MFPFSNQMNKLDIEKIRSRWVEFGDKNNVVAGGDDTIESIKMIAEKINEIIDNINSDATITTNIFHRCGTDIGACEKCHIPTAVKIERSFSDRFDERFSQPSRIAASGNEIHADINVVKQFITQEITTILSEYDSSAR